MTGLSVTPFGTGVGYPATITITVQYDDSLASSINLWCVKTGVFNLPSEVGAKMSSSATTSDLARVLVPFLQNQCDAAGKALSGGGPMMNVGVNYTPTINEFSFEGSVMPSG